MDDINKLETILKEEMSLLNDFIELSKVKRRALFSNRTDQLAKIIEEETRSVERMLDIVNTRNAMIKELCGARGIQQPSLKDLAESCAAAVKERLMTVRGLIMKSMSAMLEITDRNTYLIKSKVEMVEGIFKRIFRTSSPVYTSSGVSLSPDRVLSIRKDIVV